MICERKTQFLVEKKGFHLGKRPRPPKQQSFEFGWNLKKFTQTVYVWVYSIIIGHFSVKIALLSIFHGEDWSYQSDPLSGAKLSSCMKRLICLSRSQALCTTVGLGPLPCLFCAVIEICKLPNGLRCLGYVFFLNSRGADMAVKGLFGRQKCVLCYEAYIFSGFWAFILFSSVHL